MIDAIVIDAIWITIIIIITPLKIVQLLQHSLLVKKRP